MNAPAFPSPEHSPEVAASLEGATPFMAQYLTAKAGQPDAILFFRMGDFYELFFKDAEVAAAALGITLTKRGKHQGEDIPMAGVPVHAMEGYLARLIRLGHKVAICEQLEDPAEAKKRGGKAVVHRGVVRVVTPGTLTEDSLLDARGANRLAAVAVRKGRAAVAVVELSSGAVDSVACALEDLGAALAHTGAERVFLAGPEMQPAVDAYRNAGGKALVYAETLDGWIEEARCLIKAGRGTFLIKASRSMKFERIIEGL